MGDLKTLLNDLVAANRILAAERITDAFGHVSARHPEKPNCFLLSRARSPKLVEVSDIMEFNLDGVALDPAAGKPYLERFIHSALYQCRADVRSIIHSHSRGPIPFSVTGERLRPIVHSCATIGYEVPVWDSRDRFGDTDLLISNASMGHDLARAMGTGNTALMRGHGSTVVGKSIREAVYTAIYLEVNADLQLKATLLGQIEFLSPGEIDKATWLC